MSEVLWHVQCTFILTLLGHCSNAKAKLALGKILFYFQEFASKIYSYIGFSNIDHIAQHLSLSWLLGVSYHIITTTKVVMDTFSPSYTYDSSLCSIREKHVTFCLLLV